MPITVSHLFSNTIADDPAQVGVVHPSDWNATHAVSFVGSSNELIKWASAGANSISSGILAFANSNGVSFGMDPSGVITATVIPGAAAGIAAIQAGTQTATSGTVLYSNANGVSFGLNNGTLTGSVTPQSVQTQGSVAILGSTGAISFANGGGVTFGGNNSTLTASVAAQSVDINKAGTGFTSTSTAGSLVAATNDTNGLKLAVPAYLTTAQSPGAYLTTAALSNHSHSLNQILNPSADVFFALTTGQQIQFQFSNTGTFTTNANKQGLFEIDCQGNLQDGADVVHVHQSDNNPVVDLLHLEAWGTNVTGLRISVSGSVAAEINKPIKFVGTGGQTASVPMILQSGQTNSVQYLNANLLQGYQATQFAGQGTTFGGTNISGSMTLNSNGLALSLSAGAGGGGGGIAASIGGGNSTSAGAGYSNITSGTMLLYGGNNITLSQNGAAITISGGAAGGADGINALVVNGGASTASTTLALSNANNVSFGLNAGTITASASFPAQTVDTNKAGTGFTTTTAAGAVVAGTNDTNGLKLAMPAYLTTAQSPGAYLTTAMVSNAGSNFVGLNSALTANGVSATINSSGVSLNFPAFLTTAQTPGAYLTTARQSNDAIGLNTALTANGLSVTANSSGLSINVPAYLTTAMQSASSSVFAKTGYTSTTQAGSTVGVTHDTNGLSAAWPPFLTTYVGQTTQTQPAGNIAGVGTSATNASITLNSNGLAISVAAGGGGADGYNIIQGSGNTAGTMNTYASATFVLAGGNNITLSQSSNTMSIIGVASQTNQTAASGNIAGTGYTSTTQGGSTVGVTHNTAGISAAWPPFITTYVGQTTQTQPAGNIAGVGTTITGGASITLNSNGIQFNGVDLVGSGAAITGNAQITANSQGISFNGSGLAGTSSGFTGANVSATITHNSAGLALSMSVASPITENYFSGWSLVGNTAGTNVTALTTETNIYFSGGPNITLSGNSNTIVISAAAGGGAGFTGGVSTGGNTLGTTGTVNQQIVFVGGNNITLSQSSAAGGSATITIVGPAAGGGAFSAGATTDANGTTGLVGAQLVFFEGNTNITLSQSINGQSASISILGPSPGAGGATPLYLTYQNRQLGASSSTQQTNNQIWMVPFRVAGGSINASTMQIMESLSGTYTSAVAATLGVTENWCLYSNNTTNSTRFDTWTSGQLTWQLWNSGTSSGSWAMGGTTSSSAGTAIMSQVSGVRMLNFPMNTTVPTGLYVWALNKSTSSAGYSNLMSRAALVLDAPMPLALGNGFGAAAATNIGYVDAGTYSVTSAAFPSSIGLSEIKQHSNLVPYFKIGAI
jgi:hypothetical protein